MERQRIQWIDAVKALGIFSIYLGHFADAAGRSYRFVFIYHIPLFFFIAGCTEALNRETSCWINIKKKIKNLYLPFLMFAIFSAVLFLIEHNGDLKTVKILANSILLGCIRNTFIAGALWFLSCMFTMYVVFQVIKMVRYRIVILCICVLCFVFTKQAATYPKWAYNLDSALAYLIFYCLGYLLFGTIDRLLNARDTGSRLFVCISTVGACIYAVSFFFGRYLFEPFNVFPFIELFSPVLKAVPLIWLNIVAAYIFRESKWLAQIGKNTLYLCGSEYIVKSIVQQAFLLLGFQIEPATPLGAYVYTFFLLGLANTYFVPAEKKLQALVLKTKY